jgi:hypothetical protein
MELVQLDELIRGIRLRDMGRSTSTRQRTGCGTLLATSPHLRGCQIIVSEVDKSFPYTVHNLTDVEFAVKRRGYYGIRLRMGTRSRRVWVGRLRLDIWVGDLWFPSCDLGHGWAKVNERPYNIEMSRLTLATPNASSLEQKFFLVKWLCDVSLLLQGARGGD